MKNNNTLQLLIFLLFAFTQSHPILDLNQHIADFIIETKRIIIPEYPRIFNPSIVEWQGKYLMSFRIRDGKSTNKIGLIWLDKNFKPEGKPYQLKINQGKQTPYYMRQRRGPLEQDPRLVTIDNALFIIYSHYQVGKMFLAPLQFENDSFYINDPICLLQFPGMSHKRREKNWVPFEYNQELMFAYSINPHKILQFNPETQKCTIKGTSKQSINWKWGILRGGTPALKMGDYHIGFFHSSKKITTKQSQGKNILHYFMGAYTFKDEPPFAITHISPKPIVTDNFYNKSPYKLYKPLKVIFPAGFVFNKDYIWVFYGKHDNETWYVKLDKQKLLESLIPLNINSPN